MSLSQAAKYADVHDSTVSTRWGKKGLKPHNEAKNALTEEDKEKLDKAHKLGMSIRGAAIYANVHRRSVRDYLGKKG